jgi:hypothetical protein
LNGFAIKSLALKIPNRNQCYKEISCYLNSLSGARQKGAASIPTCAHEHMSPVKLICDATGIVIEAALQFGQLLYISKARLYFWHGGFDGGFVKLIAF